MGLSNQNSDRKTFVNIINGKLTVKTDKDDPLAVARVNKKNETVYEVLHDKLLGTITTMTINKNDFGKQLEVEMIDVEGKYLLTIPVESKYFDSFAAKIGNVDLSQELTIQPYSFQPDNAKTKRTGINFYQNGNKIDYYFSLDNPKGKPFPTKEKLDDEEWKIFKLQERKFYCEFIGGLVKPKERVTYSTEPALSKQEPIVEKDDDDSSDLPF